MDIVFDFDAELKKLDEKIKSAEENFGDIEIRDAVIDKAEFCLKHNKTELAIEIYQLAHEKSVGIARKMDIIFTIMQIYFKANDLVAIKEQINKQHDYIKQGGDWERKNRLKVSKSFYYNFTQVYEAIYKMQVRDFKGASELFLDAVSTFNKDNMVTFNEIIFWTVLTGMISLDRATMKEKILKSPDVLTVIRDIPNLKLFLESFYKCNYKIFMTKFLPIIDQVAADKYLGQHTKYFIRQMRIVAYKQFLEAYKTVKMTTMSKAFGVSVEFIDKELSMFIASKSLNCRIDKVAGVIETQRHDSRNDLYQKALKKGDVILNKVQKLARLIDV